MDSVLRALRELGHDVHRPEDAAAALDRSNDLRDHRLCRPTLVSYTGTSRLRLGCGQAVLDAGTPRVLLRVEGVEHELPCSRDGTVELPEDLPIGRHAIEVIASGSRAAAVLLRAPRMLPSAGHGHLGAFLPLYAVRPKAGTSRGIATYSDLGRVAAWTGSNGCTLFGTLPLLSTFLGEPHDPSPYAPVSRERWSELFIDPAVTPEAQHAQPLEHTHDALASTDLIDYKRVWHEVAVALDTMASAALAGPRRAELLAAAETDPSLVPYAAFRAWCARERAGWGGWRTPVPDRSLEDWLHDPHFRRFYYAQVIAGEQLDAARARAIESGCDFYLDLPVGAAADGFDTWREPQTYARDFHVGAPPDGFFQDGQDWGFRAPHPGAAQMDGHAAFARTVAAHAAKCAALRIDHVMMLHRLFWIPDGGVAADGVYVRYPAEELWAALAIEAHRHRTVIVGENLGVVPLSVRGALTRHGALGMSVGQFSVAHDNVIPAGEPGDIACFGTHDTATFTAWWLGEDITLTSELGLFGDEEVERRTDGRVWARGAIRDALGLPQDRDPAEDLDRVRDGMHLAMAAGPSPVALASLEDLWPEPRPQNVPGIPPDRYPSWRRRVAVSMADFTHGPAVADQLRAMRRVRPTIEPARHAHAEHTA